MINESNKSLDDSMFLDNVWDHRYNYFLVIYFHTNTMSYMINLQLKDIDLLPNSKYNQETLLHTRHTHQEQKSPFHG